MSVFLTNQKKLAAAVGVTQTHLSRITKGANGVSDDIAGALENATKIKKVVWASAGKKTSQLNTSLKKFYREELEGEKAALKNMARLNHGRRQ